MADTIKESPVVATFRSPAYMPPERWMISIDPKEETLGDLMLRMRTQRGWYQKDVARAMGLAPERQSLLSRYENDSVVRPNPEIIEGISRVYELPLEVVTMAAHRSSQRRQALPGPSVAIPAEPELIEAVRALFLLESDELGHWADMIRLEVDKGRKQPERPERGLAAS